MSTDLTQRGLARVYRGRLIPVMRGGDPSADDLFPEAPDELALASLSAEEITEFIDASVTAIKAVAAAPGEYINDARTSAQLREETTAAVEAVEAARAALHALAAVEAEEPEAEVEEADEEPEDEALAADVAELVARAEADEPEPELEVEEPEAVTAAAPVQQPRRAPARSRASTPRDTTPAVSMTAAAGATDLPLGFEFPSEMEIAQAMVRRRSNFGLIPEGVAGEKQPIARASWDQLYPPERRLTGDEFHNDAIVAAATNQTAIKAEMRRRRAAGDKELSLAASGGLCAPVTPYYQLSMVSSAVRPVRAALPAFNADRGGIRYARPATLASITTAIGNITASADAAGGTFAHKTCQVVDCPSFQETDVNTIFHCLQFGNLGARTFPERVAQWNNLTLAAHARFAESLLLTGIDGFSTAVTASSLGLGATSSLFGQILAAANGMRNRHRMDPEAVLRVILPDWSIDLLLSDIMRSQFQRFDTDEARITAILRSFDIEPSFHIDGASGASQVFGTQSAGALLPFPSTVRWYLFPEGAFLYVDGGTLELGLVRDSVLNSTNDFQIFGETFENVAYVGVESLAVTSTICDSGIVAGTHNTVCPIDYSHSS